MAVDSVAASVVRPSSARSRWLWRRSPSGSRPSRGLVLLYVVFYNLVTAYVARREELVLERLCTDEPRDQEILAGTAVLAVAVALAQCVALIAAGSLLLGMDLPHRPELLFGGLALGIMLFAVFAAANTVFTRSVEVAQLTTTPVLLVSVVGSGILVPLQWMPHLVGEVCRWLPLTPVVEVVLAYRMGALAAPAGGVAGGGHDAGWPGHCSPCLPYTVGSAGNRAADNPE
ncbi:ABC transporter permease [Streptomyces sp. NPDC056638]|uniref:ABC transporter permease n=1 Tax=Streptomyces sp. NPDC056638 TaxID=3345887 RepID=UPI0036A64369